MKRRGDPDRMVEAVLAGRPLPSVHLDETEAAVLRAAIELRAARPGGDHPDEAFVTDLRRRVHDAVSEPAERAGIGRRGLLAGAAAAVAAGVVGAVAESTLSPGTPAKPVASGEIVPDDGQWVAVASAEDVAAGSVRRFATASAVGFVTARGDIVSAVSGSCTHQGCLLRLNEAAGRLDCPCHRTAFALDGTVLSNQLATPPAPAARDPGTHPRWPHRSLPPSGGVGASSWVIRGAAAIPAPPEKPMTRPSAARSARRPLRRRRSRASGVRVRD